jgi:hypothetical protein
MASHACDTIARAFARSTAVVGGLPETRGSSACADTELAGESVLRSEEGFEEYIDDRSESLSSHYREDDDRHEEAQVMLERCDEKVCCHSACPPGYCNVYYSAADQDAWYEAYDHIVDHWEDFT